MQVPMAQVAQEVVVFAGGLDLVSPALSLSPGACIGAINYEPDINGGYRRMAGLERFDGRTRPSEALYSLITCAITGVVSVGDTVTGATSGATAKVLQVNGASELVVTKVVGTFVTETLLVGGSPVATMTAIAETGALVLADHATYQAAAADLYRADIQKVPGSGPVRGVWYYRGETYAFRDNAGATACLMYKATTAGWSAITFGYEIQFASATGEIFEGDTVTCGGFTGVVKRALLRTGTWTVSGAGTLVFDSVSGTMPTATSMTVGGVGKATSSSASTAIALLPGGRFEFSNYNFSGTTDKFRMFFVDGVNLCSEFDGTRLVPIRTGLGTDKPTHLACHKNQLFLAAGSSVVVSASGNPYSYTALTGAAELAVGKPITGLLPLVGSETVGALAIFCGFEEQYSTFILYGNTPASFTLVPYAEGAGATRYTAQNLGGAYYLDIKGVEQLTATRAFGNFLSATVTRKIQPLIDLKKGLAIGSCIVRASNQYRVFYSDGTGVLVYVMGNKIGAIMPFEYPNRSFANVTSYTDGDGVERIMAGGTDGYVYELDRGTSHDGDEYLAYVLLSFNASKNPRGRKRYRRVTLQATCKSLATVQVGYELNYGDVDTLAGLPASQDLIGGGGWWDQFTWDRFIWDAPYATEYKVDTPGVGRNIGLVVYSQSAIDDQHTLHGGILNYSAGRAER